MIFDITQLKGSEEEIKTVDECQVAPVNIYFENGS